MSVMYELQKAMMEVEEGAKHEGYWYCISDILINNGVRYAMSFTNNR